MVQSSPILPQVVLESVLRMQVDRSTVPRVNLEPIEQPAAIHQADPEPQEQLAPLTPQADSVHRETTHIPSPIPSVHTASDSSESNRDEVTGPSHAAVGLLVHFNIMSIFCKQISSSASFSLEH